MSSGISQLVMVLFVLAILAPIDGLNTVKKDGDLETGGDGSGVKCTACSSCENPCNQKPPPPPPASPPPPKSPSKQYCPPPPPPPYIYITGPPGNLYPFDPYYSGADSYAVQLAVTVGCSLLSMLVFVRF